MLIIKKRNIQKGFSLIELMVAVVILAIAVLGIYQAYNISFTGMADARDRTVATNYVREAMEVIKNMDFDKIRMRSRSYITGTKYEYEREVIVQESTNLKKVTTKVYWRNRKGNTKMVENGMSVHFMETSEGTATRIMLIANPYNVLTGGTSTITAVVKDDKGNTVTIWTGDISFTSDSGDLQPNSVSIILGNDGTASTTFTAPSYEGEVNIMASASGLTPDSVTLKVTVPKKPVKINLTANPTYMTADINSTSKITATIVDADGETAIKATNVITFSVSGPGTLSAITSIAPINCIARIILTSNGTPETITVTASATGLEPGVVNVFTGGQISLSASRVSVPNNETSEVTVTTKDVDGVPINYEGTINLSVEATQNSNGSGRLSIDTLVFDGSTSSIIVTFTATLEGTVNINAEDQAGILDEGSIELTITAALVPDHITVTVYPYCIKAGGIETSTITARVKCANDITLTSYSEVITFSTNLGTFPNDLQEIDTDDINVTYENGVATVVLDPSLANAGTATINVSSTNTITIDGNAEVVFYVDADHIDLIAVPQRIPTGGGLGGTCTITATIKDGETTVTRYSGTVEFSSVETPSLATLEGTNPAPVVEWIGEATIELQSKIHPIRSGTARIEATSEFTDSEGGTTEIEGYLDIEIQ
ncbi:prepilin-type N-terminal cleavage/methylation domain-containing protein [Candidatus Atribacteria bacterium 1244-E10-H5-B2]|nr:MAG: prepilin-type N-terminal cleavage/methylation domain-containing protein [Candidatus Atribacteria bacterium 1244-E10-H5-B2]